YEICKNSSGLSMSGVTLIRQEFVKPLYENLLVSDPLNFWNQSFIDIQRSQEFNLELIDVGDSLKEFDKPFDLIDKNILTRDQFAKIISDNGIFSKTDSMTN